MANILHQQLLKSGILDNLQRNNERYANITESKSLVAVYEQQIFVWNDVGSCLLTVEMNFVQEQKNTCKVLILNNPPVFEVESIMFNQSGSLISLTGRSGVMVFEVPWRYGKFGSTGKNAKSIVGRSWNVAENFFVCSNRIHVVQTAWHPGSSSSTHLTVLSTDNYLRIYDVTDPQAPQQVISLGPDSRSSYLSTDSKISFSTCLGENAVSFDFGSSEKMCLPQSTRKTENTEKELLIWPIFLLHGNGDVYIVKAPMKKERFHPLARIDGPLLMYPPAEDNYGFDACSILCLQSSPPSLVIATATNMLYHCLVLENFSSTSNKEPKTDSTWNYDSLPDESDTALYVYESVELPLSFSEDQNDVYCHPIRLYKDITSSSKYHCTHLSGVHAIAVPFLQAIEECVGKEDMENCLTEHEEKHCVVEHLLCTKPFKETNAIPVLGLDVTVCDAGVVMICLLASWDFLCLPLVSSYHSEAPYLLSEDQMDKKSEERYQNESLRNQISSSLQRSMCSPYLKSFQASDSARTSPQQWLDLLCNVTQRFREDYVQRLNTAHSQMDSRVKILIQQKEQQLNEISKCREEEESLQNGAEHLAEKYEDAMSVQQKLVDRIEKILHQLQKNLPNLSNAELTMKKNLFMYEEKIKMFKTSLDQIKKKIKYQDEKMKEVQNKNDNLQTTTMQISNLNLGETQIKHVKELLEQETKAVAQIVLDVNTLKKEIGL